MLRTFVFGIVCAALAVAFLFLGGGLGLSAGNVLYGLAAGAVLGLVRIKSPLQRLVSYLIGFALGWIFFVLQVAVFPGSTAGFALATGIVVVVATVVAGLTGDRLPLWACFLGVMTFVGAYAGSFAAAPWDFIPDTVATASTILLAFAAGYVMCLLVEIREARGGVDRTDPMEIEPSSETLPQPARTDS